MLEFDVTGINLATPSPASATGLSTIAVFSGNSSVGLAVELEELCRDLTEGVGDFSLGEGRESRFSCLCRFHSRVTASLIIPVFGTPFKFVDTDLEAVALVCGVFRSPLTARLDERLGLNAVLAFGVVFPEAVVCGVSHCRMGDVSLDVCGDVCESGDLVPAGGLRAGLRAAEGETLFGV